jgi:hypothetical protein
MIEFIDTFFTITINYNSLQSTAPYDSLRPNWTTSDFSSTVTNEEILLTESLDSLTESVKESKLLYDWGFTSNQFVLATNPLRITTSNFILQLNTCCYSPYVTSSLTRGWVCHLQLPLGLASTNILRSESRGLKTTFYCLRFETPPN